MQDEGGPISDELRRFVERLLGEMSSDDLRALIAELENKLTSAPEAEASGTVGNEGA